MKTEKMLRELKNVKERYKDIATPTFEINIHNMVTDVIKKIEEQEANIKELEYICETFKSDLIKTIKEKENNHNKIVFTLEENSIKELGNSNVEKNIYKDFYKSYQKTQELWQEALKETIKQ